MAFLGRFVRGERVWISCLCVSSEQGGQQTTPAAAPEIHLYRNGTRVATLPMTPADKAKDPGLFFVDLLLDSSYAAGRYVAVCVYYTGTYSGQDSHDFDLLAAGDPEGAVNAQTHLSLPHANFLLFSTDQGKVFSGRNPRAPAAEG